MQWLYTLEYYALQLLKPLRLHVSQGCTLSSGQNAYNRVALALARYL